MPTANRMLRRLQARLRAPRVTRGRIACGLLAICLAWTAPAAQAMPGRAAAGLQTREAASQSLDAARKEVQAAQAECRRTRSSLDAFLAGHLDAQAAAVAEDVADESQRAQQSKLTEQLRRELVELQTQRESLLQTLTEEHPEVIDMTARIEAVEARIATSEGPKLGDHAHNAAAGKSGSAIDAAEFRRLLRDWQTAERRLESARLAETAAADDLRAITELLLHSAAPETPGLPMPTTPAEPAPLESTGDSEPASQVLPAAAAPTELTQQRTPRTQTLALASLALAVMLAALAAVRLARSSADPLFASADEVSAALAVPVVGIVPFGAKASSTEVPTGIRRGLLLLAQVVIALLVFGAVAYAVVHFDVVLRTLRTWLGL